MNRDIVIEIIIWATIVASAIIAIMRWLDPTTFSQSALAIVLLMSAAAIIASR